VRAVAAKPHSLLMEQPSFVFFGQKCPARVMIQDGQYRNASICFDTDLLIESPWVALQMHVS